MRSDSTRVPPVTPERSPPASRTTGADSPVMADSSTDATPSTISPSPGMTCPASTTTRSPACRAVETVSSNAAVAEARRQRARRDCDVSTTAQPPGRRLLPRLAEGVGLGLAAGLGQRLGEVGEQHRQQQPDVQRDQVAERRQRRRRVERP